VKEKTMGQKEGTIRIGTSNTVGGRGEGRRAHGSEYLSRVGPGPKGTGITDYFNFPMELEGGKDTGRGIKERGKEGKGNLGAIYSAVEKEEKDLSKQQKKERGGLSGRLD